MKLPPTPNQRITTALRQVTPAHAGGRTNLVAPTPSMPPAGTTSTTESPRRFATVVVAASNSSDAGKAGADFVCDGTADDVEWQAASDYLQSLPQRKGRIIGLEGEFTFAASVTGPNNGMWVQGMGADVTRINGPGSGSLFSGDGLIAGLSDLLLYNSGGYGIDFSTSVGIWLERCHWSGCSSAVHTGVPSGALDTAIDYGIHIVDNRFDGCGGVGTPVLDLNRRVSQLIVANNEFANSSGATDLQMSITPSTDVSDGAIISGNAFSGNIDLAYVRELVLGPNAMQYANVALDHCSFVSVIGNSAIMDLTLTTVDYVAGSGNVVYGTVSETSVTHRGVAGNVGWV